MDPKIDIQSSTDILHRIVGNDLCKYVDYIKQQVDKKEKTELNIHDKEALLVAFNKAFEQMDKIWDNLHKLDENDASESIIPIKNPPFPHLIPYILSTSMNEEEKAHQHPPNPDLEYQEEEYFRTEDDKITLQEAFGDHTKDINAIISEILDPCLFKISDKKKRLKRSRY